MQSTSLYTFCERKQSKNPFWQGRLVNEKPKDGKRKNLPCSSIPKNQIKYRPYTPYLHFSEIHIFVVNVNQLCFELRVI